MTQSDRRYQDVRTKFLRDTANHTIASIEEHGIFRHIVIRNPDSFAYHYALTTWPRHLAITGDCGTLVFTRIHDMFEFFRTSAASAGGINPGYWSEKVVAADPRIGIEEFDMETLRESIRDGETVDDSTDESATPRQVLTERGRKMLAALDDVPEGFESEMENAAVEALMEFDQDAHEFGRHQYTHSFLWLLHAIVLGIQKHDAAKAAQGAVA